MTVRDFVRYRARDAHHWAWNQRLRLGDARVSHHVNGSQAEFLVGDWKEYWRATSTMNEPDILERTIEHTNPGDIVWDVGANVGTYSVHLAKQAEHVIAFEPVAGNYRRLLENLEENNVRGDVMVCAAAISDRNDLVPFWVKEQERGEGTHKIDRDRSTIQLPAYRGDDLNIPSPDVIKIDVEGHEQAVLDGMPQRLQSANYVIVETHDDEDVDAIRAALLLAGLEPSLVDRESSRSETFVEGVRG